MAPPNHGQNESGGSAPLWNDYTRCVATAHTRLGAVLWVLKPSSSTNEIPAKRAQQRPEGRQAEARRDHGHKEIKVSSMRRRALFSCSLSCTFCPCMSGASSCFRPLKPLWSYMSGKSLF